jgi:hypothetical protein
VMGLEEIAAGVEVTTEQRDPGVATIDATGATLEQRLEPFADDLPCSPAAAATVLDRYTAGASVGAAGRAAGVAPATAARVLHLLGESVSPAGPTGRDIVADWVAGDLARSEAIELSRLSETEFALAAYVETHEPIDEACAAIEGLLAARASDRDRPLSDAVGEPPGDFGSD